MARRGPDRWLLPAIRRKAGTTAKAAQALHVTTQTISNWNTGKHKPDDTNVRDLAKLLDISESELRRKLGMPTLDDTTVMTVERARLEGRESVLTDLNAWLEQQSAVVATDLKHLRRSS